MAAGKVAKLVLNSVDKKVDLSASLTAGNLVGWMALKCRSPAKIIVKMATTIEILSATSTFPILMTVYYLKCVEIKFRSLKRRYFDSLSIIKIINNKFQLHL